ncbi:MAG: Ig-like domain-containing protein [Rikenellaceae bacterium]
MKYIINRVLGSLLLCATILMNYSCTEDDSSDYYELIFPSSVDITYDTDEWGDKIYYDNVVYSNYIVPLYVGLSIDLDFEYTAPEGFNTGIWQWTSSNEEVATVDENGLVTAVGAGYTVVNVGIYPSQSTAAKMNSNILIRVTESLELVSQIEITSPSEYIYEGGYTSQLSATVSPDDATYITVSWSSSDTSVATVDSDGLVTAKELSGTENQMVTITATAVDGSGISASTEIEVRTVVMPQTVAFSDATMALDGVDFAKNQDGFTIDYIMDPLDATPGFVEWTTSNSSVATVEAGVVTFTGYSSSPVTITATCVETGDSAEMSFSVPAGYVYEDFSSSSSSDWDWAVSASHISSGTVQTWNSGEYLDIIPYQSGTYSYRSDLYCFNPSTIGINSTYPLFAVHMLDVLGLEQVASRNMRPNISGTVNGTGDSVVYGGSNNNYVYYYELDNGTQIAVWDLAALFEASELTMPSGNNVLVPTGYFNFVYADIKGYDTSVPADPTIEWELHAISTFKTAADIEAYITNVVGTGFTETKFSAQ